MTAGLTTPEAGNPAEGAQPLPRAPLSGQLLRRQVVQYAPGVLLPALVSIASAAIFTRVFSSGEYGRFSLASSVAAVMGLLLAQWLHQGIARYVPSVSTGDAARELKTAIALALGMVIAVTLAAGLASTALASLLLPPPWPRDVLAASAVVLASVAFGPLGAVIQSEMQARRYSTYVVTTSVLRLLLALALVFLVRREPSFLLWAQAGALGLAVPPLWRAARLPAAREVLARWRDAWPTVRAIAAYGFPVVGFTVSGTILDLSDRWVLQYFRGAGEVGIYAANYSLVFGTVGLVALPMLLATHPFLMRAWEGGDRAAAGRWLGTIVEWYVIAGALVVGVVGFYSRDIANLLLGEAFRPGHRIIPIVLGGMVVWQLGSYSHKPLEFVGRTGTMFGTCVAVTLLNLVANVLVVPRFGYMGAAFTSLACYVLYTVVMTSLGRRILPWTVRWPRVLASLGMVVLGLGCTALVRAVAQPALGYLGGLLVSAVVALATTGAVVGREILPLMRAARAGGAPTASR